MGDKQLKLDQRTLSQVTEMEDAPSGEEINYLLEATYDMADGTTQETIADTTQPLSDEETRYLLSEERTEYDEFTQVKLETGVNVEREQAEITDYETSRVASD